MSTYLSPVLIHVESLIEYISRSNICEELNSELHHSPMPHNVAS